MSLLAWLLGLFGMYLLITGNAAPFVLFALQKTGTASTPAPIGQLPGLPALSGG